MDDWLEEIEKRCDGVYYYEADVRGYVLDLRKDDTIRRIIHKDISSLISEVRRLREENEKLLCSCGELEKESKQWRRDAQALFAENERLREELSVFDKSEKKLSDAYLRIRELVGAWDTKPGGEDRFEVTEAAVRMLLDENETLLCSCGELEEESKHWRKDAQALFAENERLREENEKLKYDLSILVKCLKLL